MKRIIAIAAAFVAIVICSEGAAQAQSFLNPGGFPYPDAVYQQSFGGAGLFGGGFSRPRAQPPYFAQFPPVYYSHAVKRPYGISPYAAPAGIVPVELSHPHAVTRVNPKVVINPHVKGHSSIDVESKTDQKVKTKKKKMKNKVASWQTNPFFEQQVAMN